MKVLLKLIAIFIILLVANNHYIFSKDERIANKITMQVAKKISAEKGLAPIGTGGQMMDEIKMLMLGFDCRKIVNMEAARELLVYCVEEYLAAINASEEIRPYLYNYPFSDKNIEIDIYFFNPDGSDVPIGDISVAAANKGRVIYEDGSGLLTIHEETYKEATQKVKR